MYIINGATSGIGLETAKLCASTGEAVIAIGRNFEALENLTARYENIRTFQISDVSDKTGIRQFLEFLDTEFGDSSISYMHSAGVFLRDSTWPVEDEEGWSNQIQVNLMGTHLWNKYLTRYLVEKKLGGSIVNVVSQAWKTGGFSPISSYAASKGGIVAMTKNFARLNAELGIRFNCLAPGFVNNELMTHGLNQQQINSFAELVPMKRLAEEIEIARAALYLLSDDSSYVTGIVLDVTGGLLLDSH